MPAQAGIQASRPRSTVYRYEEKEPAVYILASTLNGTLYVGCTSDLYARMMEHKNGTFEGFTKKYGVTMLVYYEIHETMPAAIERERRIKKWNRLWKIRLIEEMNPTWADLFDETEGVKQVGPSGQNSAASDGGGDKF